MWKISVLCLSAGALWAQHEYAQTDIENGARLYTGNCIYCHGPDGDQMAGVDLGRNKFKRAVTDEDLIKTIRDGVEGTGMPAQTNMPEAQIATIVAYIRSMASVSSGALPPGGDAARGRLVFENKGGCTNCHRVHDKGSRLGPDLSDVGAIRRGVELQKSILDPNAVILPQHRFFRVVTKDGKTVTGRILNQDTFTVELIDSQQKLVTFQRSDLKEFTLIKTSPMPSFKDKLSSQELADVVAYLVSLKGI